MRKGQGTGTGTAEAKLPARLVRDLRDLAAQADGFGELESEAAAESAGEFLRDVVVPRRKAVESFFAPLKAAAHAAHKAITAREREVLADVAEAEATVKRALSRFVAAREAAARAAQLAEARASEALREAAVLALAEAGDEEAAERLLAEPPAPVAAPAPVPRIDGVAFTTRYRAEVRDLTAFLRWVGTGSDAEVSTKARFVTVNSAELNRLAAAQRELLTVPGVAVVAESGVAVRSRD